MQHPMLKWFLELPRLFIGHGIVFGIYVLFVVCDVNKMNKTKQNNTTGFQLVSNYKTSLWMPTDEKTLT